MDRRVWWATVHRVAKSRLSTHSKLLPGQQYQGLLTNFGISTAVGSMITSPFGIETCFIKCIKFLSFLSRALSLSLSFSVLLLASFLFFLFCYTNYQKCFVDTSGISSLDFSGWFLPQRRKEVTDVWLRQHLMAKQSIFSRIHSPIT